MSDEVAFCALMAIVVLDEAAFWEFRMDLFISARVMILMGVWFRLDCGLSVEVWCVFVEDCRRMKWYRLDGHVDCNLAGYTDNQYRLWMHTLVSCWYLSASHCARGADMRQLWWIGCTFFGCPGILWYPTNQYSTWQSKKSWCTSNIQGPAEIHTDTINHAS